ncbi:MAG: hypothetical protein CR986_03840 [Ignavibacteriae bacterium]|nr:MAG: hypothetical protein CR986_03840 [Ignavibacteriota bacterium]
MLKYINSIFVILIFCSILNYAQSIKATATTDSVNYLVGDYISYTIRVEYEEGIRIAPPKLIDNLKRLEVIKVLPVTFEEDENVQVFHYILSGYDSSRVIIPKIPVTYFIGTNSEPKIVKTNEVEIFIHTLDVDLNAEIKDIKEPVRIPLNWLFWLLLLLGIIIIAVVTYLLYRKFIKSKQMERIVRYAPVKPFNVLALEDLDELKEKKLWQQGKVKEYHSEITGILRKYFENRYNFNSLEMTTTESMEVLNKVMDNQKLIDVTGKFLQNADMVKFAKFQPMPSLNEEMMHQAYDIVYKTQPDDEPLIGDSNV